MGCGSSSAEEPSSFAATEAEHRRQMREDILRANPLSLEQALERLTFDQSGSLRGFAELVGRSPNGCFSESDHFSRAVKFCVKVLAKDTDADLVKQLLSSMLAKGADPNLGLPIIASHSKDGKGNYEHCYAALEVLMSDPKTDPNLLLDDGVGDSVGHVFGRQGQDGLVGLLEKSSRLDKTLQNKSGESVLSAIQAGNKSKHLNQIASCRAVCFKAAKGDTTANLGKALAFLKQAQTADGVDYLNQRVDGCPDGLTLLGIACRDGTYVKTLSVLLEGGCDPDHVDKLGQRPDSYLDGRPQEYRSLAQQLFTAARARGAKTSQ